MFWTSSSKSITTRSGSTITLDDDEGAGSITIKDPSGNRVYLDGAGNITITAPNKFTLNATDIEINGGNSVKVNRDSTTCGGGEGTIALKAKKSIDATADTDNISLIATEKDINVTAEVNLALEGKSSAEFKKDDSNKILISGSVVDIDGGKVQIN